MSGTPKEQLAAALKNSTEPACVRSAFDLPPAQQSAIDSAVKETFGEGTQVQFDTAPELVSGIELSANGQKVAWSIADYLATLAKSARRTRARGHEARIQAGRKIQARGGIRFRVACCSQARAKGRSQ